jgi:hypothetical protein
MAFSTVESRKVAQRARKKLWKDELPSSHYGTAKQEDNRKAASVIRTSHRLKLPHKTALHLKRGDVIVRLLEKTVLAGH